MGRVEVLSDHRLVQGNHEKIQRHLFEDHLRENEDSSTLPAKEIECVDRERGGGGGGGGGEREREREREVIYLFNSPMSCLMLAEQSHQKLVSCVKAKTKVEQRLTAEAHGSKVNTITCKRSFW